VQASQAHKPLSPTETGLHILVVEDHRQTAETIELYLKNAGYQVTLVHDGAEGLRLAQNEPFDLLVLDILLPGADGRTVLERLRDASDVPVIMLTSRGSERDRCAGLNSGADDYMVKPFSPKELVARVGARLRSRQQALPSAPLKCGPFRLDPNARRAEMSGTPLALTPTEFNLLAIFVAAPDRVYSKGDLVERLFGFNHEGSEQTIASHVFNLRRAIEKDPKNPALLKTVFGVGYRLESQP